MPGIFLVVNFFIAPLAPGLYYSNMDKNRYITKARAAELLGVSRAAMQKDEAKYPIPAYYVTNERGRVRVDTEHDEWKDRLSKKKLKQALREQGAI